MFAIQLDLPIGAQDQHGIILEPAQQVMHQGQRTLIRPMQVVEKDQQSLFCGQLLEKSRDIVE